MYLDTDIIFALIKKDDWLKPFINFKKISNPVVSAASLIELELVVNREHGKDKIADFFNLIKKLKIKIDPINSDIVYKSAELISRHNLTIFDSIHAAYCISKKEKIISSDTIFDSVKELKRVDPRDL